MTRSFATKTNAAPDLIRGLPLHALEEVPGQARDCGAPLEGALS